MRAASVAALTTVALALAAPPAGSQSAGFSGPYRLLLTFGPACRARIASLSLSISLTEAAVAVGTEIDGRPSRSDETTVAEITLLRTGSVVHGPFATLGGRTDREPITSQEGLLFLPWLVLDGVVTATAGRPQAKGTAFGFLAAGRDGEEYPSSLAACTVSDFTWSLDPQ